MSVLYVSDLDGTLLGDNRQLSAETIETINAMIRQGIHFSIATARSFETAHDLLAPLDLCIPIILVNGVFIYDPCEAINLESHFLPREFAEGVIETYRRDGLNPVVYTLDGMGRARVYYRGIFNRGEEAYIGGRLLKKDARFQLTDGYACCLDENIITINAIGTTDRLIPTQEKFASESACTCHFGPDIYAPGFDWLEVSSCMATKKQGVLNLKKRLGLEKIVCFGDNLNDLPMFEVADECFAVANAHPKVSAAATRTIGSNNESGVARYLKSVL